MEETNIIVLNDFFCQTQGTDLSSFRSAKPKIKPKYINTNQENFFLTSSTPFVTHSITDEAARFADDCHNANFSDIHILSFPQNTSNNFHLKNFLLKLKKPLNVRANRYLDLRTNPRIVKKVASQTRVFGAEIDELNMSTKRRESVKFDKTGLKFGKFVSLPDKKEISPAFTLGMGKNRVPIQRHIANLRRPKQVEKKKEKKEQTELILDLKTETDIFFEKLSTQKLKMHKPIVLNSEHKFYKATRPFFTEKELKDIRTNYAKKAKIIRR